MSFSSPAPNPDHINNAITEASSLKEAGNQFFQQQKFKQAIKKYKFMFLYLNGLDNNFQGAMADQMSGGAANAAKKTLDAIASQHPEGNESWQYRVAALKLSASNNLSICYLKTKQPERALKYANEALQLEPSNVKAKMRRFQANLARTFMDQSLKDLNELKESGQLDAQIINALQKQYDRVAKQQEAREKKVYNRMFSSLAK